MKHSRTTLLVVAFLLGRAGSAAGQVVIREFDLPAGREPSRMVLGPDGALWFTEAAGDRIGRITTAGAIVEYSVSGSGSEPTGIVAGPDGALWFTERGSDQIGRLTTAGVLSNEFPVSGTGSEPLGITIGPGGYVWFTETGSDQIAVIFEGIFLDGFTSGSTSQWSQTVP